MPYLREEGDLSETGQVNEHKQASVFGAVRRSLPAVHIILCAVGLFAVAWSVAPVLAKPLLAKTPVQLLSHQRPFFFEDKPATMMWYVLSCGLLGVYWLGVLAFLRRDPIRTGNLSIWVDRPWKAWIYLLAGVGVNTLWMWRHVPRWYGAPWVLFWLSPLALRPVGECWRIVAAGWNWGIIKETMPEPLWAFLCWLVRWPKWLIVAGCVEAALIFAPFVIGPPRLPNEFYDLPETTILTDEATGKTACVDNHSYINSHNLLRGVAKYDPRVDLGHEPQGPPRIAAHITDSPALVKYVEQGPPRLDPNEITMWNPERRLEDKDRDKVGHKFFYDANRQELVALGAVQPSEYLLLQRLASERDAMELVRWLDAIQGQQRDSYTNTDKQFLYSNAEEVRVQAESRYLFHHHNFLLGAISELELGRPAREVNAQYGIYMVAGLRKVMDWLGGVSWQLYQKMMFCFYYIYLAGAFLVAHRILRNSKLLGAFILLAVAVYMQVDYHFLQLAPGQNPIRHFFDFAVLWLLYRYAGRPSLLCLAGIWAAVALSLAANSMTGLFLGVAAGVTLAVARVGERRGWARLPVAEALLLAGCLLAVVIRRPGQDHLSPYYIQGLLGFELSGAIVAGFCLFFVAALAALAYRWSIIPGPDRYLLLACTFYSMGLFFYYIWGGTIPHALNFAVVYVFGGLVFVKVVLGLLEQASRGRAAKTVVGALIVLACALNAGALYTYAEAKQKADKNFASHVTYQWKNPRAQIVTTTPEDMFDQAAGLIRRYDRSNGIHILSKYDAVLPFLAERYSAMPFPDLQWFIVSPADVTAVADAVSRDKPEYLFVDTDIDRAFYRDLIGPFIPKWRRSQDEALMRAHRLMTLRQVFDQVRGDYQLAETSPLLSVWKRKGGHDGELAATRESRP